jgi:hypothetical protein
MHSFGALIFAISVITLDAGAAENPTNLTPKARAIIAGRDKIVTPNGVQESFAAGLGGTKQWSPSEAPTATIRSSSIFMAIPQRPRRRWPL